MSIRLTEQEGGVRFGVKVVPGSSRDRIVGALGDVLKIAVSAPPQRGRANDALVALLAGHLRVSARSVRVVRGHASPRKEIYIAGISAAELSHRLGPSTDAS